MLSILSLRGFFFCELGRHWKQIFVASRFVAYIIIPKTEAQDKVVQAESCQKQDGPNEVEHL
jgi:hypothetical protein